MNIERNFLVNGLINKLNDFPAVVLLGARQVGKTTIAKKIAELSNKEFIYLDLESIKDVNKLNDDPETFFAYHEDKLIILDEIQTQPYLFSVLRSVIDKNRNNGRFLMLGSASPELVKGVSESLAGRVLYFDMNPLNLEEIKPFYSMETHWFRGGFPLALIAKSDQLFLDWSNFIRSYVSFDLSKLFAYQLNSTTIHKLLIMLSYQQGQTMNMQDFSRSIGVSSPIISRYIDFLEAAFLVNRLQPWFQNVNKRLVKSPKVYIRDSGLLHTLSNVENFSQLTLNPIIGSSWEGYVVSQISYLKPKNIQLYFYRTQTGSEIDLVLVKGNRAVASIEIKYSNAPKPSKGFFIGIEDLQTEKNFLVTPTSDTYPIKKAIVCNLDVFISEFLCSI